MEVNTRVPVTERSQVSGARAAARELARESGFSEEDEYRVSIVASELSTNLIKYAEAGGELLLRRFVNSGTPVVEMIAIDRGAGIPDLELALSDGHSSSGSAGTGLGAVRRLSDVFDLQTTPQLGTAVLARVAAQHGETPEGRFRIGTVCIPYPGETISGDGWLATADGNSVVLAVVDGLGHGLGAHDAARACLSAVAEPRNESCARLVDRMHAASRHTRGAASSIASIVRQSRVMHFAGIGNVAGVICSGSRQQHLLTTNGTIGHQARPAREQEYPWSSDSLCIMHTDGLTSHWSLDRYPGLLRRHPALIAAVLYRDFSRQRDDVTVLVAQEVA